MKFRIVPIIALVFALLPFISKGQDGLEQFYLDGDINYEICKYTKIQYLKNKEDGYANLMYGKCLTGNRTYMGGYEEPLPYFEYAYLKGIAEAETFLIQAYSSQIASTLDLYRQYGTEAKVKEHDKSMSSVLGMNDELDRTKDFPKYKTFFLNRLKLDSTSPSSAVNMYCLGAIAEIESDFVKAKLYYSKICNLDRNNCATAYVNLGLMSERLGKIAEANNFYSKACEIDKTCCKLKAYTAEELKLYETVDLEGAWYQVKKNDKGYTYLNSGFILKKNHDFEDKDQRYIWEQFGVQDPSRLKVQFEKGILRITTLDYVFNPLTQEFTYNSTSYGKSIFVRKPTVKK